MNLPLPEPGLVIHYGFLWGHESDSGLEEARYPRPSAIVVARRLGDGDEIEVMVVPFTHIEPQKAVGAIELPRSVQDGLGLPKRTWAVVDQLNIFVWPGFDLARNAAGDFIWGRVPAAFLSRLRDGVRQAAISRGVTQTRR